MIKRSLCLALLLVLALTPLLATHLPAAAAQSGEVPSGNVIVMMRDNVRLAETTSLAEDVEATATFGSVLNGFAANVTPEQAAALAADPSVAGVFPDNEFALAEEYTSSLGTRRVGAPAASHDLSQGLPAAVNATVAVIDTGVSLSHPALNVGGGFDAWSAVQGETGVTDCGALTPSQQALYEGNGAGTWGSTSNHSHGSSVAGVVAANGTNGVTGVAPGAQIIAIKVWDTSGIGNVDSKIICGLAWLQANKARFGIDVVNMSLETVVTAGECETHPVHQAICNVVNGGTPIVSANGNTGGTIPTGPMNTYDELIAVTSMNDFDGRPGGLATSKPSGCFSSQLNTSDDLYATYNEIGSSDIMAPGTCLRTTTTTSYTTDFTGTSAAAPLVAGAIALYASSNPSPSDAAARAYLSGVSVPNDDPDGLVGPGPAGVPMLRLGPAPVFGTITPNSGAPSSTVTYTLIGYPANATVEITWEGVDGEIVDLGVTNTNPNGDANGQITVPDTVPGGAGQQVHFTAGNFVKTFTFETRPRIRFHEVTATPGQTVHTNGRGFAANDTLTVRWRNGNGQFVTIGTIVTNNNGNFTNVELVVPEWAPSGANTVRMEGEINQNTSSLTVIAPGVQIAPVRTTVNNWITYDLSNFPPSTQGTITWTRLSGGTIDMGTFDTDEAGNATGQIRVPATPGGPGQIITFEAGGASRSVEFEVAPRIKSNTDPGVRGGQVDISLRGFAKGESYVIRWRNPSSGAWVTVGSGTLSNTGSTNIWITVPNFAPDGNNSVRAESASFNQQTNVVNINGGNPFDPSGEVTPTPEPTATPEPTETPAVIDTRALPLEAPLPIAEITDDAFTPDLRTSLTDGQITTGWSAVPDPVRLDARVTINLGGLHQVSGLAWLTETGGCGLLAQVEYSTDGVTWIAIDPAMIPDEIGQGYVWRFFGTNVQATMLRLTVVQAEPGQTPLGCIAEVEVWGTPVSVETPTATAEPTIAPDVPTPTSEAVEPADDGGEPTETPET